MTETAGQELDAKLAELRASIAKLEAAGKTDWAKVKAYVGANLPHVATWAGLAGMAFKLGLLKF